MNKYFVLSMLLGTLLLAGCSTKFAHPSGRNWDYDWATCERQSIRNVCYTSDATSTTTCEPNNRGSVTCSTTHTPASTSCQDEKSLSSTITCLKRLGWREVDAKGNYK